MKIRHGLVSNSSTSSFICLIPLRMHDEILAGMDFEHCHIAKKFMDSYVTKLHKFGQDMVTLSQTTGNETNPDACEMADELLTEEEREVISELEDEEYYWNCVNYYTDKIKELEENDNVIVWMNDN